MVLEVKLLETLDLDRGAFPRFSSDLRPFLKEEKVEENGGKFSYVEEKNFLQKFFFLQVVSLRGGFWIFFSKNPSKLKKVSKELRVLTSSPPLNTPLGFRS